ncbi:hypothetical protein GCM10027047_27590 [Rhodococcus aerolatus]
MGSPTGRGRLRDTDHLTTEAVVAYVDGELGVGAHQRASGHLAGCEQCTLEVHAQQQARAALRTSGPVSMPSSLLGALCRIPDAWDARGTTLRGSSPGQPLAVDVSLQAGAVVFSAHSGYVAVLRPDDFDPDDPSDGTGAAPQADQGSATAGQGQGEDDDAPAPRRRPHRRILPFAVVAVSATAGLLVAGSPARSVPAAAPAPARVVQVPATAGGAAATRPTPADADFTGGRAG